jgi:stage V sporulation protein B
MATYRGFFQGMQIMTPTSLSQIIESAFRVVVGVGLAYFLMSTKGVAWAAGGASFGATAGALAGGILMTILYRVYKRKGRTVLNMPGILETEKTSKLVKTLFAIAIPASLASVVVSIMNMINSVTVARCLQNAGLDVVTATELWGQLSQKVQTLINVPMMVGVGLAAALVPAISESFVRKNYGEISDKTALALRAVMIIGVPSMIGLSVLSDPIIKLLFGAASGGGQLLKFQAFECVTSVAFITCQAILQGMGKMMLPIRNLAIGAVVKMILNIVLVSIPSINIYGIIIATFVADCTILTLNYVCLKKYIRFKLDKVNVFVKPLLSGAVMGSVVYFIFEFLKNIIGSNFAVIIAIAAGVATYLLSLIICGGIDKDEIKSFIKRKRA